MYVISFLMVGRYILVPFDVKIKRAKFHKKILIFKGPNSQFCKVAFVNAISGEYAPHAYAT